MTAKTQGMAQQSEKKRLVKDGETQIKILKQELQLTKPFLMFIFKLEKRDMLCMFTCFHNIT